MTEKREPRRRRAFTNEFKTDAVQLCASGDRTIAQVARDLDLNESSLRNWITKSIESATPDSGQVSDAERDELKRLRKRVNELEMDRAILKKAAVFFAKENL
jgi:transposase-like protein